MNSELTLILTPSMNDAKVCVEILKGADLRAHACSSPTELAERMRGGCGAVVIATEALTHASVYEIQRALESQPTWSDLPVILLTTADSVRTNDAFSSYGNTSLLERPLSKRTLIRAVQVALRARRRQYQVSKLLEDLTKAKETADRASYTKTQFLANMSHEIRTPIGAIIGFSDLIRQAATSAADREKYTEIIQRNSHQLLRLIDDILDLSKVEAGKLTIETIEFKLPEVLIDISSIMRFRANENGIDFKLRLLTQIPERIFSDPVRVKQILSNIIGNAIKFTTNGSVEMSVAYAEPILTFKINDTGLGMTPDQSANLFKAFVQADPSTTRKFGGTGLGLSISKQLANSMGGNVVLESSKINIGSTFAITLKVSTPNDVKLVGSESLSAKVTASASTSVRELLKDLKVLLVEDSPDNQMLITRHLTKAGCTVATANDGEEGVTMASKGDYDVVLMDIQMPKLDGHGATKRLRAQGYTKPIVALTAHAMQEEKQRGLKSGFTDFLTKPIQPHLLVEILAAHAGRSH